MKFKLITQGGSELEIFSYAEGNVPDEVVVEIDGKFYKIYIKEIDKPE